MSLRALLFTLAALVSSAFALAATAHEVRPAFLQVTERNDGKIDVLFKQPATTTLAVRLDPDISGGLLSGQPAVVDSGTGYQTRIWKGVPTGKVGLGGRSVTIHGLDRSITDALVVVHYSDGHDLQQILRPGQESLSLDPRGNNLPVLTYVQLGITHILTGYDHLMFVLGLVLLVKNVPTLLKTITAFTVAHSITLAATALGIMTVKPAQIEALVALSIVFVAIELANVSLGRTSVTQRWPWLIAFAFGLLHGSAFAGALAEIGLPKDNIPAALLLFNIGVEIGQLVFVGLVLAVIWGLKRIKITEIEALKPLPTYAIGAFAAFWVFERLHAAII
ncbi:HupE/UreJ family protein [Asticcacaulis solisilvae]|uniref:HupE/UreJ family protein n=1 Tax=Asticcacaulis solisilvae TaxID=1217274 RepID=UPI003FD8EA3C